MLTTRSKNRNHRRSFGSLRNTRADKPSSYMTSTDCSWPFDLRNMSLPVRVNEERMVLRVFIMPVVDFWDGSVQRWNSECGTSESEIVGESWKYVFGCRHVVLWSSTWSRSLLYPPLLYANSWRHERTGHATTSTGSAFGPKFGPDSGMTKHFLVEARGSEVNKANQPNFEPLS
jgi:hypothetical protein